MLEAIDKALSWGKSNLLTFSPSKTEVILFSRCLKPQKPAQLQMGNISLPYTSSARYLGVFLDS